VSSPLPLPAERGPYLGPETGDVLGPGDLVVLRALEAQRLATARQQVARAVTEAFPRVPGAAGEHG
jgi:hypothetical protein